MGNEWWDGCAVEHLKQGLELDEKVKGMKIGGRWGFRKQMEQGQEEINGERQLEEKWNNRPKAK